MTDEEKIEQAAEKHGREFFEKSDLPGPGSKHDAIFRGAVQWRDENPGPKTLDLIASLKKIREWRSSAPMPVTKSHYAHYPVGKVVTFYEVKKVEALVELIRDLKPAIITLESRQESPVDWGLSDRIDQVLAEWEKK